MFASLKNIFSNKNASEGSSESPPQFYANPYFVTETAKVIQILKAIEAASSFCSIELNNTSEIYTSRIIAVNEDKNLLSIDELIPAPGNQKLEQCKQLKLSTYLNNIHLSIALNDISITSAQDITYYQAPLPNRIFYPQRRNYPRIAITAHNLSFQGVSERTGLSVIGTVFDISRNGIGIMLTSNTARVQRGDQLVDCVLALPDYSNIHFNLNIRVAKPYDNHLGKFLVGGYFSQLKSTKQLKQLEQFYALVERSEIRNQKEH